jgi:hypothetical protein
MPSELHDLEKRADQHRLEALKKIDALTQESVSELKPSPSVDGSAVNHPGTDS